MSEFSPCQQSLRQVSLLMPWPALFGHNWSLPQPTTLNNKCQHRTNSAPKTSVSLRPRGENVSLTPIRQRVVSWKIHARAETSNHQLESRLVRLIQEEQMTLAEDGNKGDNTGIRRTQIDTGAAGNSAFSTASQWQRLD